MVSNPKNGLFTSRSDVQAKRRRFRHLLQEGLERRELLATIAGAPVFAPGTSEEYVNDWINRLSGKTQGQSGPPMEFANVTGARWYNPVGGPSPIAGEPATVTWSIVPDGTQIADGTTNAPSNLIAFLDGIYGSAPGPVANRPWFQIVERVYNNWSQVSGINFVYEPNDDGAPMNLAGTSRGVLGVRGDARVSGARIDGNFGILAYNYFPNQGGDHGLDGDMVIDTGDIWYSLNAEPPTSENRGIFNVWSHELGHGIGLGHVQPVNETKLMEPFVSLQFLGPQHDDILGANIEYGDTYEPNESKAAATDLGDLLNGTFTIPGLSINRVQNLSDPDWFQFVASSAGRLSVTINPIGEQYVVGADGGGLANVNTLVNMNLRFSIEDLEGNQLAFVDTTGAGEAESIIDLQLPAGGAYFIQVDGTGLDTQLYSMTIQARGFTNTNSAARPPRLLSVSPNTGENFNFNRINVLSESPRELVFRFDGSQLIDEETLSGIKISRSGGDRTFGEANDVVIQPAWIGFGETERIVIARFGSPLPDDIYKIEVLGVDLEAEGRSAIRNIDGKALVPRRSGTDRDTVYMNLELGAQIIAVHPQPIIRNAVTGVLTHQRNRIEVYFNDDDLHPTAVTTVPGGPNPTVVDPAYYQLILTRDTVNPNDDVIFNPTSISYDPATDKAVLIFAGNLDALAGGSGTFRLRIGSREVLASAATPSSPTVITPGSDPGDTISGATNLGTFGAGFSAVITENIQVTASNQLTINYPGSNFEPGHRDIQDSVQTHLDGGPDVNPNITKLTYTFALDRPYGIDPTTGRPLTTSIDPIQQARVREVFDFFSAYLGIDFAETEGAADLTIVVGDMSPLGQQSGPGGFAGVAGQSPFVAGPTAIMDGAETWDNGFGFGALASSTTEFATGQAPVSFFVVAMHEIGHLIGLGHTYEQPPGTIMGSENLLSTNPLEWFFPGNVDIVHGQHIHRPDNRDVDIYRFVIPAGQSGNFSAETYAERLNNASDLDTQLTLMRRTATGGLEVIAINDNYFSKDSYVNVNLGEGEYFVAIVARGNETFNPLVNGTGSGGVSQGRYELRVHFKPTVSDHLTDARGTQLDGDGDGRAGGNFNFWFRTATPVTSGVTGGPKTIYVDKQFTGTPNGSAVAPFRTIPQATAVARDGDIIRIAATTGSDRNLLTLGDNRAYEIGTGGVGLGVLQDGRNLEVPKGVTLMIEPGAIFKFGGSHIQVGSSEANADRSGAAIQVLGVPGRPVYFTSYFDESLGFDTNPLPTTPQTGDWGGIEMRLDSDRAEGRRDREQEGVFLNYVGHGIFRYGGGTVGTGSLARVVAPLHMTESRPTLLYNQIELSADSGMSADPNSFEETLFTHDRYQLASTFTPDYSRVGPDIRGTRMVGNSLNGLLLRVDTLAGSALQPLTVTGRLDDTDVTFILGENLIVNGNPGGNRLETVRPNVSLVQLNPATGGSLTAGQTYRYVMTFVDRFGGESLVSLPTAAAVAGAGRALTLTNLPIATGEYVGRRLWRSTGAGGAGPFELVAQLNRDSATYTDLGSTLGGTIASPGPATKQRPRLNASLIIDPGIIVKALGTRIEVGVGATMLAEGVAGKPVVFTSRLDDRYGASGNFDANNDGGATTPAAGDWAGIISRHLGTLSLDNVLVTFGGGSSAVPGGFASFNAIEIHQSEARIANSIVESNANGRGTVSSDNRAARGFNDATAIFVTGSQPIIVNNIIRGSDSDNTAAISIDANSMKAVSKTDYGRSTGLNSRVEFGLGNMGPLVQNNLIGSNGINGMRIRGATLTTETAWDDTDIVHVLQSIVLVPDFHTYGGLRLQSKANESLVVKLRGTAGITASGRPLDIPTRIGGSVQILGAPGFPVVMTSLRDDSIGAGFDPQGRPQVDTDGQGPSAGAPGDWRSIRLDVYSNDRNVETITEFEADQIQDRGNNDIPDEAQDVGQLASSIRGGDENLRLGFTIHGAIAASYDLDVYRFTGVAGTPVWFDIDQTSAALDAVVELIDINGNILAQSSNSLNESLAGSIFASGAIPAGRALPMDQSSFAKTNALVATPVDFQTVNPLDPGFRITLPGVAGAVNPYYVRVRSSNLRPGDPASRLQDTSLVTAGVTTGTYRLQVRLQQQDEVGGSTIRFADIRYAANGIEVLGMPMHSPLIGETAERSGDNGNEQPANAINVGNFANADRGGISIAGSLANRTDVDWYRFSVHRDSIQIPGNQHISAIFDIDYADGLGRPDTTLWVYRLVGGAPQLVLIGTDSDIADDRAQPGRGSNWEDLSRGSLGIKDAFIGAAELPDGDYLVAVTNSSISEVQFNQFTSANALNPNIRIEPLDGFQRLVEDRFDPNLPPETNNGPMQVAFNGNANAVPWTLANVTMYVAETRPGPSSRLLFGNAYSGAKEAEVSTFDFVTDIATRTNGEVWGYVPVINTFMTDANSGQLIRIDERGNGTSTPFNLTQIQTVRAYNEDPDNDPGSGADPILLWDAIDFDTSPDGNRDGHGLNLTAMTFASRDNVEESLFVVARRGNNVNTFQTVAINPITGQILPNTGGPVRDTRNYMFRFNTNGQGISPPAVPTRTGNFRILDAGTNIVPYAYFNATGIVSGLAEINNIFWAVSDQGELFAVNGSNWDFQFNMNVLPLTTLRDPDTLAPIAFTSLAAGPRNVEDGRFANILFGLTANGTIYAINTATLTLAPIFPRAAVKVQTTGADGLGTVQGLDFSVLDVNLWHRTNLRGDLPGHGQPSTFNGSRQTQQPGQFSMHFGFVNPANALRQPGDWTGVYDQTIFRDSYDLPGGSAGAIESNPLDLRGYTADDQPMLYFTYWLDTQTRNSPNTDGIPMLDALRVYGAGPDGNWILLATNNSANDNNYNPPPTDEFDPSATGYVDAYGREYRSQELFDRGEPGFTGDFRQARVSMAPFAGLEDVRLRFEFSTAATMFTGDPLRGGVELTAVKPTRINDGDTFVIQDLAGTNYTFEFDLGLVLDLPSGASIQAGDSITVQGNAFTFVTGVAGPGQISFTATMTPAQIAAAVSAVLTTAGFTVVTNSESPSILNISGGGITPGGLHSVTGLNPATIIGRPGVAAGNFAVPINQSLAPTEAAARLRVRDAIRASLAANLNAPGQAANLAVWPVYHNTVRLYGFTVANSGPLGATTSRPGDAFGPTTFAQVAQRAQDNFFGGVHIDDIVIGFAERGEAISNFTVGTFQSFEDNSFLSAGGLPQTGPAPVYTGAYQLEIRTAATYGTSGGPTALTIVDNPFTPPREARTFDTNSRLTKQANIFVAASGGIVDGTVITLSDGVNTAFFEFDVIKSAADRAAGVATGNIPIVIEPGFSAPQVARAIRDAINGVQAQSIINITAATLGEMRVGAADLIPNQSAIISLFGDAAVNTSGSLTFTSTSALIGFQSGVDTEFGEDLGDSNIVRDNGQVLINSNIVSHSSGVGILIDAGPRQRNDLAAFVGERPYPGSPRNLVTLNSQGLATGVVVVNNIVANNAVAGIVLSGDQSPGNTPAPSTIARVINNTVYGRTNQSFGIVVNDGATPTLLNNIISNNSVGIFVDPSSSSTVSGGNLYKGNNLNVSGIGLGSFPIVLNNPLDPLFIDPTNGRFYLAPNSRAIDSSLASLEERFAIRSVRSSIGQPVSPMIAPSRDVYGLVRADDPAVNTPSGQGQTVFIDRGAVDRTDFLFGPKAILLNPLDNDSAQVDVDRTFTNVRILDRNLQFFSILISDDLGSGPDSRTITADSVILTENGRLLIPDVDYVFGYSQNSTTVRLTPLSGLWRRDSVYEITLINAPTIRLSAPVGNLVADGEQLTVTLPNGSMVDLEYESGFTIRVPKTLTLTVPPQGSGPTGILDGQQFTITRGSLVATFEFDTDGNRSAGTRGVTIPPIGTATEVRNAILNALLAPANSDLNLAPKAIGTDSIHLGSLAVHSVDVSATLLTVDGVADGVRDGDRFTYTRADATSVDFEFNLVGDATFGSGTLIPFLRTDTHEELAAKIVSALGPVVTPVFMPVHHLGNGAVHVGGEVGDLLDVSNSNLQSVGNPGVGAAYTLTVPNSGGVGINDGQRFLIRVGTITRTFEFTKDLVFGSGNRPISITNADDAATVAIKVANAIRSAGLGLNPTTSGAVISLHEPLGTFVDLLDSPLTLAGSAGGAIPIYFAPGPGFSSLMMAAQITKSLNQIGLGVKAQVIGDGNVLVQGVASVSNIASIFIGPISDIAGNRLQANRNSTLTQFTIVMPEARLDYGDAAGVETLQADNGARHALLPEDEPLLVMGRYVDADNDGQPNAAAQGDDMDARIEIETLPLRILSAGPAQLRMPVPNIGLVGQFVTIRDAILNSVIFEFTNGAAPVNPGAIAVNISGAATDIELANRFSNAALTAVLSGRITEILPVPIGNIVSLGGSEQHLFDLSNASSVHRVSRGRIEVQIRSTLSLYADGQTVSVTDGSGNSIQLELNDTSGPITPVAAGRYGVDVDLATATPSLIAQAIGNVINQAIADRLLDMPLVTVSDATLVFENDDEDGVRFLGIFNQFANPVPVVITATNPGVVDAWFDWNNDGDFTDAGEQMLISQPVLAGDNIFYIQTPVGAQIGFLASRFRLSTGGALLSTGVGLGGEVEDHLIEVVAGRPPVARDRTYTMNEDGVLTRSAALGVLSNDTDLDGDVITVLDMDPFTPGVQLVTHPENGTLVIEIDGSFVYTPDPDYFGTDTFVYYAFDGRMRSNAPATVTINVRPINDRPTAIDDTITILEDEVLTAPGSLFWSNDIKGPPNESGQTLTLVGARLINPRGNGETVSVVGDTLTYRPPLHYNNRIDGPVLVELRIRDGGVAGGDEMPLEDRSTLTINLTALNDAPIFTIPGTLATVEDAGLVVVPNFATGILPGPVLASDEVAVDNQQVTFLVRALDPSLFDEQPSIDASGTLQFRLAPDVNNLNRPNPANLRVEVIAVDNGPVPGEGGLPHINQSPPKTFVINATPINDAPEFTIPSSLAAVEDEGARTVVGFATGIRPGPATANDEVGQTLTFVVQAVDPSAFKTQPAISPTGTLTFELAKDVNSLFKDLTVNVFLRDNGSDVSPNVNVSPTQSFTIIAADINDIPSFSMPVSRVVVLEDNEQETGVSPTTFANFMTNIRKGPDTALDEIRDQTVSFAIVSNSNPGLFHSGPTIDPAGNLSFLTAAHQNGTAVIVVRLVDSGRGAPAPNVNQSLPRTFTITVQPVNDAPEFTIPSSVNAMEDQGLVQIPNFATGMRPGPLAASDEASQSFTVFVQAVDPTRFLVQPTVDASGTLRFQTRPDVNRDNADLRVRMFLRDNGASTAPNVNISPTVTFTLNVAPINDAPSFAVQSNTLIIDEDREEFLGIPQSEFPGFVHSIVMGPPTATDEVTQTPTFTVSNTSPELFEIQPFVRPDGTLVFKIAKDRSGRATFVIGMTDSGASGPAPNSNIAPNQTVTVTITAINDPPEFTIPASISSNEDQGVVTIPGFATDIRRGPITALDESTQQVNFVVRAIDPTAFEIQPTINPIGTLSYKTALDVNRLTASKDFRVVVALVDDGPNSPLPNRNRSPDQTFSINVNPINDPPIPSGHNVSVNEDSTVVISAADILVGDVPGPSDEIGQSLRITQVELTSDRGGIVVPVFNTAGDRIVSVRYTAPANLAGNDFFRYVVTDNGRDNGVPAPRSATGTVTVNIIGINDPPQFDPGPNQFVLEDSGLTQVDWATNILAGPPGADDENLGPSRQTVRFEVTTNRPELFTRQPEINSAGRLFFRPAPDANGRAIVTVVAVDSGSDVAPNNNRSTPATFTINIEAVNDPPVFTSGGDVTVDEDSGLSVLDWATGIFPAAGLGRTPPTAQDEASQRVTFDVSTDRPQLFAVQPTIDANGRLRFAPATNAFGTATVTVVAIDNGPVGGSNNNASSPRTFRIVINQINDAPIGADDRFATSEDEILVIAAPGVLANDTDPDLPNDVIRAVDGSTVSRLGAIVVVNPDGSFRYDPTNAEALKRLAPGQTASDTFTYFVQDNAGLRSSIVTVTVAVSGVNDPPIANDDRFAVAPGRTGALNVLANDTDPDSAIDPRTIVIGQIPISGVIRVLQTGIIEYTANSNFRGSDTFTYRVRDVLGALSNEATVVVTSNLPPVANPDSASTFIDTSVFIDVARNDSDPDGTIVPSSVRIVVPPSSGTARVLADGRIEYTPALSFTGSDSLSYTIQDNEGSTSNIAEVSIRVGSSIYQNPRNNLDVNNDGFVSPIDALLVINDLIRNGIRTLQPGEFTPPPFIDVDGNRRVEPRDVLTIINFLNLRGRGGGEGESSFGIDPVSAELQAGIANQIVSMVTPEQMLATVAGEVRAIAERDLQTMIGRSCAAVLDNFTLKGDHPASNSDWDSLVGPVPQSEERHQELVDSLFADDLGDFLS